MCTTNCFRQLEDSEKLSIEKPADKRLLSLVRK
jgi:hypothetical protein